MDQVLGDSHAIVPPILLSSSGGTIAMPMDMSPSPRSSPKAKRQKPLSSIVQDNLDRMAANDEKLLDQQQQMLSAFNRLVDILIIIIIIKICSAHISTLLGAQGAETEKHEYKQFTVISKTKL